MPVPISDLLVVFAENQKQRVTEICSYIDEGLVKKQAFPCSIQFEPNEVQDVILQVAEEYKKANYNVLVCKVYINQKCMHRIYLNHNKPYTDKGSNVLFTC